VFSDEAIALLAQEDPQIDAGDCPRQAALASCLEQLSVVNRDLITSCYSQSNTNSEIALSVGQSTDAVYKRLQRVRLSLYKCIEARLAAEDA
jgi:DNA-directed RNA polymerase specialized sigma24 family protein